MTVGAERPAPETSERDRVASLYDNVCKRACDIYRKTVNEDDLRMGHNVQRFFGKNYYIDLEMLRVCNDVVLFSIRTMGPRGFSSIGYDPLGEEPLSDFDRINYENIGIYVGEDHDSMKSLEASEENLATALGMINTAFNSYYQLRSGEQDG